MKSVKWKFETHTVKLEFVYSAHSNRRWDLVTWLRPWDQTTNYAVEACQFSKPSVVQDAGISWQDNVHCFLGCWRYTADWLHAAQGDNYRGLLYYADLLCKLLITSKEKSQGKLAQVPVVLHETAPVQFSRYFGYCRMGVAKNCSGCSGALTVD